MTKQSSGLGDKRSSFDTELKEASTPKRDTLDFTSMLQQVYEMYNLIGNLPVPSNKTYLEWKPKLQAIADHCKMIFENAGKMGKLQTLSVDFFFNYADILFRLGRCESVEFHVKNEKKHNLSDQACKPLKELYVASDEILSIGQRIFIVEVAMDHRYLLYRLRNDVFISYAKRNGLSNNRKLLSQFSKSENCDIIGPKFLVFMQTEFIPELKSLSFGNDLSSLDLDQILTPIKNVSRIHDVRELGCLLVCLNSLLSYYFDDEEPRSPSWVYKMLTRYKDLPSLKALKTKEATLEDMKLFTEHRAHYYFWCANFEGFCGNNANETLYDIEAARIYAQLVHLCGVKLDKDARKMSFILEDVMHLKESRIFFDEQGNLRSDLRDDQLFQKVDIKLSKYK